MEVGKCVSILQPLFLGQYRRRIIDGIDSTEGVSALSPSPFLAASITVARRANMFRLMYM